MPSPFPGMNPYIECPAVWADFHKSFLVGLRAAVVAAAGPGYVVKVEEHVYVRDVEEPESPARRVPYLTVTDRDSRAVLTVIELLSPANKKPGPDRELFLAKRRQLSVADVNYVELDFLRGFPRLPVTGLPACDYYALVSRPAARPAADLWPVRLRDPLPPVPVPLRAGEAEPLVPLQPLLHRVYDDAGYAGYVYDEDPDPPLSEPDLAWARGLAR